MPSTYGPRLQARLEKPRRPGGIAVLATLGVLGSLLTIMFTLIRLILLMQISVEPSRQLGALGIALIVALVVLWINWGLWELIRWAWWGNLIVSLASTAALVAGLRYVPAIVDVLGRIWKSAGPQRLTFAVLAALIVAIAYHLIAVVYMLGVHAAFKVGVKDERPLWERVQRN